MSNPSHDMPPPQRPEKVAKAIDMRDFIIKVIRERGGRKEGWRSRRDEDILKTYDDPIELQADRSLLLQHPSQMALPDDQENTYPDINIDTDWSDYDLDDTDDWPSGEK